MFHLIVLGLSRPEPVEEDSYQNDADDEYQDDDQDYAADYDDDTSKDQSGSQGGNKDGPPAYFEQEKVSKAANASQTIALACPVKNFGRRKLSVFVSMHLKLFLLLLCL